MAQGKAVSPGEARAEMEASGWVPVGAYVNAHGRWECVCASCGRTAFPSLAHVRAGRGCRRCASLRNGARRAISDAEARSVALAAGMEPQEPYPGRNDTPWNCACVVCGALGSPLYSNMQKGRGCRECSPTGFKPDRPAVVYLVEHAALEAVKIGVMGARTKRVHRLGKAGWERVRVWDAATGRAALRAEAAVVSEWRGSGLPVGVSREQMPWGGYGETIPASDLDIDHVDRIVRETIVTV